MNLLENDLNLKNVRGSKAVGEPPLLLSISVWAAVKDALYSTREDRETLALALPASHEEILSHL